MKRKKEPLIAENVLVTDMAAEGKCVARFNNKVLFIDYAAPGDILTVKVVKDKKSFAEAVTLKIHRLSEKRSEPFCEHFGVCGGCKWQHINYETQLYYKTRQVKDNFERIGKLIFPEILPVLASKNTRFYRNKLEYSFSNKKWLTHAEMAQEVRGGDALGFHIPGRYDKILDIKNCYLQPEPSNQIRLAVKEFAIQNNLEFFDIKTQKGLLRNLIIRTASTGEVMVIIQLFREEKAVTDKLMSFLSDRFPTITSLYYVINPKGNETFHDLAMHLYRGKPFITEQMENLQFRIGPKSFYQTNSEQAYELYKVVRDFAELTGDEVVYDLYTGTGTIANFVAGKANKVIGVEFVPMAIEDAKINSEINGVKNTVFFAGDMKNVLTDQFVSEQGRPDVIITDPPRAGMHADVVEMLRRIASPKIVYVSCNPATQARDLALLSDMYEIKKVQPVDMFPHTAHVENVCLLTLR